MFKIIKKEPLNPSMTRMVIEAPFVARKAMPGQFIILRVNETGERIPLTIADYDREAGTVTIIYQKVGKSTLLLDEQEAGGYLMDFIGPLGKASELEGYKKAAVIGGGAGCAIAYPQAKALHAMGTKVDMIAGFRDKDLIILENEMREASDRLIVMTDDGSNGNKGFVTAALQKNIDEGADYDLVIAIGPIPMMKAVSNLTKPYGIKTIISMNTIMVDGTGMCGGCRLTVGGETKFACVDGPDFDGHLVDFDEAMKRLGTYKPEEAREREEHCRLYGGMQIMPNMQPNKTPMPEQDPHVRNKNFKEVALGYTDEMAINEAQRCLQCKNPACVQGCPVNVPIPDFIHEIVEGNMDEGLRDHQVPELSARRMRTGMPSGNPVRSQMRPRHQGRACGYRPPGAVCGRLVHEQPGAGGDGCQNITATR